MSITTFTCPHWKWVFHYDACDPGVTWACALFGASDFAALIQRQDNEGPLTITGDVEDVLARMLLAQAGLSKAVVVYFPEDPAPQVLKPTWTSVAHEVLMHLEFIADCDDITKRTWPVRRDHAVASLTPEHGHLGKNSRKLIAALCSAMDDPLSTIWAKVLNLTPADHPSANFKWSD